VFSPGRHKLIPIASHGPKAAFECDPDALLYQDKIEEEQARSDTGRPIAVTPRDDRLHRTAENAASDDAKKANECGGHACIVGRLVAMMGACLGCNPKILEADWLRRLRRRHCRWRSVFVVGSYQRSIPSKIATAEPRGETCEPFFDGGSFA
jgi:hypothetical protein